MTAWVATFSPANALHHVGTPANPAATVRLHVHCNGLIRALSTHPQDRAVGFVMVGFVILCRSRSCVAEARGATGRHIAAFLAELSMAPAAVDPTRFMILRSASVKTSNASCLVPTALGPGHAAVAPAGNRAYFLAMGSATRV
jgi:hypothetical protein